MARRVGDVLLLDRGHGLSVLRYLRSMGYVWRREPSTGGHRALWSPDLRRCVGEWWQGRVALDARLLDDVPSLLEMIDASDA